MKTRSHAWDFLGDMGMKGRRHFDLAHYVQFFTILLTFLYFLPYSKGIQELRLNTELVVPQKFLFDLQVNSKIGTETT